MARVAGIDLQDNWKVDFALTKIKGIGWHLSKVILNSLKIDNKKRVSDLSNAELAQIASKMEEYPIEGELIRIVRANVDRLKDIGSYRGMRHAKSLPARGQRTRRNARTKRGKRKTVGAFKKEMLAKEKSTQKEE